MAASMKMTDFFWDVMPCSPIDIDLTFRRCLVMMIMSVGLYHVSELWIPVGILFIPQVIYDNGEPWWMISTGENFPSVHQNALWQSYQQSYLVANQEVLGEGNVGFCVQSISFIPVEFFYMP
jgi:hypothetical protein